MWLLLDVAQSAKPCCALQTLQLSPVMPYPIRLLFLCLLFHPGLPTALAADFVTFRTEPSFRAEKFRISNITSKRELLAPGYLFIDPFVDSWGTGPQIYAQDGQLIWYGNASAQGRVQDLKVCDYLGQSGQHLCWHEGEGRAGPTPVGRKVIFDSTYTQVGSDYTTAGNGTYPNTHEFRMIPGGQSFIQTVYQPRNLDLSPYAGPKDGWVFDGCFMEIATRTGHPLFKWCYLDNHPVWDTKVFIKSKASDHPIPHHNSTLNNTSSITQTNLTSGAVGMGTWKWPWDFMHLNAVDKNAEGDYLVSSRYFDQILKIAGPKNVHGVKPGSVIWRLGGKRNDFHMNFNFSRQHCVRFISTSKRETVISLFSNNWDGHAAPSGKCSEGQLIRIRNGTNEMRASLLQNFPHPDGQHTRAQGSMFHLPNGNFIVGWGIRHETTEFSPKGKVLFHAQFQRYSYRVEKAPWVGQPPWRPKLLAYAQTCGSDFIHAYVSWNGATEVSMWRFQIAASETGPWDSVGVFVKDGFETSVKIRARSKSRLKLRSTPTQYVLAEALDYSGAVIGSVVSQKYIPCSKAASPQCDSPQCTDLKVPVYPPTAGCAALCYESTWILGGLGFLLVVLLIEGLLLVYSMIAHWENPAITDQDVEAKIESIQPLKDSREAPKVTEESTRQPERLS